MMGSMDRMMGGLFNDPFFNSGMPNSGMPAVQQVILSTSTCPDSEAKRNIRYHAGANTADSEDLRGA